MTIKKWSGNASTKLLHAVHVGLGQRSIWTDKIDIYSIWSMQQAVGIELNKFITLCTRTVLSFLIYRDLIIFNQKHFWRVKSKFVLEEIVPSKLMAFNCHAFRYTVFRITRYTMVTCLHNITNVLQVIRRHDKDILSNVTLCNPIPTN